MDEQVILPIDLVLGNPKLMQATSNLLEGPDWEVLIGAFYDLMGMHVNNFDDPETCSFPAGEVCIRRDPEDETVFQVILSTGDAIELRPVADGYTAIKSEDDLGVVSAIYGRIVRAIEQACPELVGEVNLDEAPTPANRYLRDEKDDKFKGSFSLLSDENKKYTFEIEILDVEKDELKATVTQCHE